MRQILLAAILSLLAGCSRPNPAMDFEKLTQDFIYGSLALSPVSATGIGYHVHNGVPLDELLDDYSAGGLDQQRNFYRDFQMRIAALDASKLDKEQRVDLDIIKNNIELGLLELDTIQSYKHNPTIYVELVGNALFTPYMLNYAPVEKRFDQITRRLERIRALFDQAKAELVDAPEVWNRVAQEENDGNIGLIDQTLRDAAPESKKAAYGQAAEKALAAVRDFNAFLKNNLSAKTSDWRLGKEKYARKFALVLQSGRMPEDLLAAAETDLKTVRAEMAKLAAPKTVEQALADVAKQHATPATYMDQAKETLAQATAFVQCALHDARRTGVEANEHLPQRRTVTTVEPHLALSVGKLPQRRGYVDQNGHSVAARTISTGGRCSASSSHESPSSVDA